MTCGYCGAELNGERQRKYCTLECYRRATSEKAEPRHDPEHESAAEVNRLLRKWRVA